jgi:feruloyl-CoA synthase
VFERMTPGLVFAAEGARFERALADALPSGVELVVSSSAPKATPSTTFTDLQATPTAAVDAARDRVDGDTVAKVLFTPDRRADPKA